MKQIIITITENEDATITSATISVEGEETSHNIEEIHYKANQRFFVKLDTHPTKR